MVFHHTELRNNEIALILPSRILIRLVEQQLVNFCNDLWCQLGQQLETLDIVDDLFRPRRTGDNGRDVFILQAPCQG